MFQRSLCTLLNISLHIFDYTIFVQFTVELGTSKPTLIATGSSGFLLFSFFTVQQNSFSFAFLLVPINLLTLFYNIPSIIPFNFTVAL